MCFCVSVHFSLSLSLSLGLLFWKWDFYRIHVRFYSHHTFQMRSIFQLGCMQEQILESLLDCALFNLLIQSLPSSHFLWLFCTSNSSFFIRFCVVSILCLKLKQVYHDWTGLNCTELIRPNRTLLSDVPTHTDKQTNILSHIFSCCIIKSNYSNKWQNVWFLFITILYVCTSWMLRLFFSLLGFYQKKK